MKHTPQINSFSTSPNEILDAVDTGDDMQRRLRYQHAYGVILLLAALSGKKPYTVLWCEHHEDLLGQRNDGLFDAYQVKTRQDGRWNLSHQPIKDSIKRFVEVDMRFPGTIKQFFFVSNAYYEDSKAKDKVGHSPKSFLQVVKHASSPNELKSPFNVAFEELRTYCQCDALSLMTVLKKLDLLTGPSLDSFEAVIAQEHLPAMSECQELSATALAQLRDDLIAKVNKASSLSVNDPVRHWHGINQSDRDNPILQAKSITTESILSFIHENRLRLFQLTKDASTLSRNNKEILDLYLAQSFEDDRVAKLDQAGETDPERTTLLHQVFVDLELKPRNDQPLPPHRVGRGQLELFADIPEIASSGEEKLLSAMNCFLKEVSPRIVVIGGPGQGKSTLGQYLAQVHRATLLGREEELYRDVAGDARPQKKFQPQTVRLPFRIVLKYFAQWLADDPALDTVEAYIAEQIGKGASRPGEIDAKTVHEIFKLHPTLLILDGLDEVTEQVLCNRMLTCIEGFLARLDRLGSDMQIIATSRPTTYKDQFTPKLFWHLELQVMSIEKVREYAACWIHLKEPIGEEQRRIRETLEDCLKESHTSQLLTTPLQVTIILLIIKDGGSPPSQREELFQQFWITILRREKSKARGMIRTEDTVLFNLHAYLGYLLHRNAVGKNVRSLFPTNEFEELVCNFLRLKDDISAPITIKQRAALIVEEARTRLVLLVEPEPGFFGFELRSLQEFFAGAYLVQTANDTQQRFDRLRAIALSEHWHNVALFCAGRIVRDYSGEAFKILEDVCRPIDRDAPDTYLRRGARLALDIAADGIFTMSNRNLQHSAVELSLTVLQTGITLQGQNHLTRAFQRLSSEDRRDILSKLLKQKLASLPLSCLPTALMSLGSFIESKDLIRVLEVLLTTNKQEYILPSIQIGFRHGIETQWLARQIEKHWHFWTNSQLPLTLQGWWSQDRERTQKIFLTLSLTEDQASNIMDRLLLSFYDEPFRVPRFDFKLMESPATPSEQIVVFLQCWSIIHRLLYRTSFLSIELRSIKIHHPEIENVKGKIDEVFTTSTFLEALDQLMDCSDLLPQLRACLWFIYWQTHEPTEPMVTAFISESRSWSKNQSLSEFVLSGGFYFRFLLLTLAMESQINNDQNTLTLLRPYLTSSDEISFKQQISAALQKGLDNLSREEQFATVLCCNYTVDQFPELVAIAEKLGVDSHRLINTYAGLMVHGNIKLSLGMFREIFLILEKSLVQLQNPRIQWWPLLISKWELDHETTRQGVTLLHTLIERLPQQPAIFEAAVILFLKLLCFDNAPLLLAPTLLSAIVDATHLKDLPMWELTRILLDIPEERLIRLTNFTSHEDPKVQQGALALWADLVEEISEQPFINKRLLRKTKFLRFDWKLGLHLIKDAAISQKRKGIMLLIYSRFPTEMRYLQELGNAIAQAQDNEEIEAWNLFLRNTPISRNERKVWQRWLETLLDAPQTYSSSILTAVMERYTQLSAIAEPRIKDEHALGLPALAPSKAERTRS